MTEEAFVDWMCWCYLAVFGLIMLTAVAILCILIGCQIKLTAEARRRKKRQSAYLLERGAR